MVAATIDYHNADLSLTNRERKSMKRNVENSTLHASATVNREAELMVNNVTTEVATDEIKPTPPLLS